MWSPLLLLFIGCAGHVRVQAQLINGQFFTAGLTIIDSPSPHSTFNVGSQLNLALDVSADGLIPLSTTNSPTGILNLNLFLVSAEKGINFTLSSSGEGLLAQEVGSTVKHLNVGLPGCLPAGEYDVSQLLDRID